MGTARAFPNRNTARGTRHGLAKLNPEKVLNMRKRYAAGGVSMFNLACEYDVSTGTVAALLYRKTWKHV